MVIASKLRALFSERGIDGGNALTSAFGCYRLELPEGTWIDVIAAESAVETAETAFAAGDLDQAKADAELAASLLEQPFLPGADGGWVEGRRRRYEEVRVRALDLLTDASLRAGDGAEAAKWAEQSIALEPFRESGYRRLMEAHAAAGNRAEALRVYERCRRLLADELGAYPSPETESIYRALLDGPARGTPVADRPAAPIARRRASRRGPVAVAVVVALTTAAVAGAVAARGGKSRSTPVAADSVGLIAAGGNRVSTQVQLDEPPTAVAVGEGAVWAANATAGTVSRIDLRSRDVRQTVPVGASPSGIAVGGGGVWVANHDDNTVSWINPESNTVVKVIPVGAGPTAVAYGFGSVWVANADDRTVTRIDAATGRVTERAIRTNAVGRGIAVGGGSVWVTDEATRSIYGIDPATNEVTASARVGAGPIGIAYRDGSLWVANTLDDTVSHVDAVTLTEKARIPVAGGPSAVALADNAIWVSSEFGSRVVRIDPRRDAEVGSTPIANRPEALAADGRDVWVAVQASGEGHRGGRLVSLDGVPASIDPTEVLFRLGVAADPAYETLTTFRHVGGAAGTQPVPNLAAALPLPTDGGRSYTFHLRPGIRYSDGRPLRAADFRRALERALRLDPANYGTTSFAQLVGAAGCIKHRRCDLSRGVIVQGPSKLTFRLRRREPRFELELAGLVPVPAGTPARLVGTRPIPSTGPYQVRTYVPDKLLTLVRNPYFHVWSAAARPDGYPDEIVLRATDRSNGRQDAGIRAVLAGRADIVTEWRETPHFRGFAAHHPLQMHVVDQQATEFMFLNVRRPPFSDLRVRHALNYGVDRKRVAALVGASFVEGATCQVVPPTMPGYRPYCPYTVAPDASGDWKAPDLARARALIEASGTRGQTVVVWFAPNFTEEARYLVSLLRRLGYRARLHATRDWRTYMETLGRTPSAQAGFISFFTSGGVAADALGTLRCGLYVNWSRFCDRRLDARVARLAREEPVDPIGTESRAAAIDRELTDRAAYVPLVTPRLVALTSARTGNVQVNGGAVLLDQLWVR